MMQNSIKQSLAAAVGEKSRICASDGYLKVAYLCIGSHCENRVYVIYFSVRNGSADFRSADDQGESRVPARRIRGTDEGISRDDGCRRGGREFCRRGESFGGHVRRSSRGKTRRCPCLH